MKILVFNCGSSSLKYRLIAMPGEVELAGGEAQRIGPPTAQPARIVHRARGGRSVFEIAMKNHAAAFAAVMKMLEEADLFPDAAAHRLVHGGALFSAPAFIDRPRLRALNGTRRLAPLHNPPAIDLIEECRRRLPRLAQVAVFDTAFHATIPPCAREYALPHRLSAALGIRKFGFHGTSHQYVAEEAARFLRKPLGRLRAVSCHLGSGGASLCAVVNGKSADNTMGYSPLQGLVMSTRCGDLDPAIVMNLLAANAGDRGDVERILNRQSGVLGLSGLSSDIRDVLGGCRRRRAGEGQRLQTAAQVYLWRLRKYLGAYLTVAAPADAIIFTDTIGETIPVVRWAVCSGLGCFGVKLDNRLNLAGGSLPSDIACPDSTVRILVIATNEELAIARRAYAVLVRRSAGESK